MTKEIGNILNTVVIVLLIIIIALSWSRHKTQIELNGSIKVLNELLERAQ